MIAVVMALLGTYLILWNARDHGDNIWPLYLRVVILSLVIWLSVARLIAKRSLSLPLALLIGLLSPLVGGFLMPFGIWVVLKSYYICFPVGVLTGYAVWRVMTSPWPNWSAPA